MGKPLKSRKLMFQHHFGQEQSHEFKDQILSLFFGQI